MTKTPTQLADDAAEAVRSLNHATQSHGSDWQYPGDAYSVVASLSRMAAMLPQALGQLEGLIGTLEDDGRLRSDHGPDELPQRLLAFHGAMAGAIAQARLLRLGLDRAHQALGAVGSTD